MTYSKNTPLTGQGSGSAAGVVAWMSDEGKQTERPRDVRAYLDEIFRLAPLVGLNPDLLVAQSAHETDFWSHASPWWPERLNPAGIGITGDPKQNAASQIWQTGADAALAQIVHMAEYVAIALPTAQFPKDLTEYDQRLPAINEAELEGTVKVLGDLGSGRWAADPNYASKIVTRANEMFPKGGTVTPTFTTVVPGLPGGPLITHYPVTLKIVPASQTINRPGIKAHTPRRSVQHGNGNPNALAAADAQWLFNGAKNDQGKPQTLSFHVTGDDRGIWVCIPLDEVTWQAADGNGQGNMNGLSCEMSEAAVIWNDQQRSLICIANCADFMGRCAARLEIAKPEQHWDFNWVECCNTPCDVACGDRHNCPDKLRHSTIAGRTAWDVYVGDWNAAKTDELARMHGTTPAPQPPASIPTVPWGDDAVGPQKMPDGSPAIAFLMELTALRDVPVRATATRNGRVIRTIKKHETVKGRGTMRNKSGPYALPDLGTDGVGRAAWSAFKERPPKP